MRFVIVTGMSGAGKTTVLKFFEDLGFFCADNLPPSLLGKFAEVCFHVGSDIQQAALGIDIRGWPFVSQTAPPDEQAGLLFGDLLAELDAAGNDYEYEILFLDASDETLIKRYKESRRSHPLARNGRVIQGIERERELLRDVRERAAHIIDTSGVLTRQLRAKITELFMGSEDDGPIITVVSFGFKYGIPEDSDLVWDVRFLPNPFYVPGLRDQTGLDSDVQKYVMAHETSREFLTKAADMLEFLLPNYAAEGKNQLVISVGCTGGRHRSVALAQELARAIEGMGRAVQLTHRDIRKDV